MPLSIREVAQQAFAVMQSVQEGQIDGTAEDAGRIVAAKKGVAGHLVKGAERLLADEISGSQTEIRVHSNRRTICNDERIACLCPDLQVGCGREPLMNAGQDLEIICSLVVWHRDRVLRLVKVIAYRAHSKIPLCGCRWRIPSDCNNVSKLRHKADPTQFALSVTCVSIHNPANPLIASLLVAAESYLASRR